jgi:hypothetical protein
MLHQCHHQYDYLIKFFLKHCFSFCLKQFPISKNPLFVLWECCWWFWTGLLWMVWRHAGTFSYKCCVSQSLRHKFMFCESCKIQYTELGWSEFMSGKWYLKHWWVFWRCLQVCKASQNSPLFVASLLNHSCGLYGFLTLLRLINMYSPLFLSCGIASGKCIMQFIVWLYASQYLLSYDLSYLVLQVVVV